MQEAIEKSKQNAVTNGEREQLEDNAQDEPKVETRPKVVGEAKAKAKANAKAKAKTKGKGKDKDALPPKEKDDSKVLERKAFQKATAMKGRYFVTVAEAAVLSEAMKNDPLYEHLASEHNKSLLERAEKSLKSAMGKTSPSGKLWNVWAERSLADLKTEMDPTEFRHELMEFPRMLEKPLDVLEGTVKVFKEVHTKMLQAKKGN